MFYPYLGLKTGFCSNSGLACYYNERHRINQIRKKKEPHLHQQPFISHHYHPQQPASGFYQRCSVTARRFMPLIHLPKAVGVYAVLPEAALGADRYLSSLTTISDVEVSADLQVVKVYVSVFGDERGREVDISGLKSKAKYVRSELGRRMKLRLTPEIRFIEDESLERGSRVIAILDRLKNEKNITGHVDDQYESSDLPQNEREWEEDDPDDEGIIYVK
ncbi:hypothetical protein F0562_020498 [Nyssa sinensis]|uniref:Ribosome-binding factor A n=1 Tax=Nyssa sinensis TaxID=561372 RepID=A0A5J5BXP9_9ASTE|nr:hypothetical protein F0562_020498 [Nyssa sinensis]